MLICACAEVWIGSQPVFVIALTGERTASAGNEYFFERMREAFSCAGMIERPAR